MFEHELNQKMPKGGQHILGTLAILTVVGLGGVVMPKKAPAQKIQEIKMGQTQSPSKKVSKPAAYSLARAESSLPSRGQRPALTPPAAASQAQQKEDEIDLSGFTGQAAGLSAAIFGSSRDSKGVAPTPKASAGADRTGSPFTRDPNIFASLAKQVMPSVVNLSAVSEEETPPGARRGPHSPRGPWPRPGLPEEFFSPFHGEPHGSLEEMPEEFEEALPEEVIPDRDSPYAWGSARIERQAARSDTYGSRALVQSRRDRWGRDQERGETERERPRREERPKRQERHPHAVSLGTGVIIDAGPKGGLILTNNHVVMGSDRVLVQFSEEEDEIPSEGRVVGRDPDLDIALIKVETKRKLEPAVFGDSEAIEVGEYVMAIGNPFGQGHSVTHGIISARGRNAPGLLGRYIQTDAPINPGNSGGPLVNLDGQVIAINNAIDARAQGIGFAIPINLIKEVLPELVNTGHVSRGYLGVNIVDTPTELAAAHGADRPRGPVVAGVQPGGPAYQAGIRPDDVITEFNGKEIKRSSDLVREVTTMDAGGLATVKVIREGKEREFKVSLGERVADLSS